MHGPPNANFMQGEDDDFSRFRPVVDDTDTPPDAELAERWSRVFELVPVRR
jgi:hypothetical protein